MSHAINKLFDIQDRVAESIIRLRALDYNDYVLVLFHIPRTGGSSIWRELMGYAGNCVSVYDLFYETLSRGNKDLNGTRSILSEDSKILNAYFDYKLIMHHHINIKINDLLDRREPFYITYLRDPVERFISELKWIVVNDWYNDMPFPVSTVRDKVRKLHTGDRAWGELLEDDIFMRPYASYYLNQFWGLMNREDNLTSWRNDFTQSEKSIILRFIEHSFLVIGNDCATTRTIVPQISEMHENLRIAYYGINKSKFYRALSDLLEIDKNGLAFWRRYKGTMSSSLSKDNDISPSNSIKNKLRVIMKDDYWLLGELNRNSDQG